MTEQEWLTCANPAPMLEFLKGKASDRKLRLFAVACCRRIWDLLTDQRSRRAVEVAEEFADRLANDEARRSMENTSEAVRSAAQALYDSEVNESTYAESDEVISAGWTLLATADAAKAAKSTTLIRPDEAARQASEASSNAEEWEEQARRWWIGEGRGKQNTLDFSEKSQQAAFIRDIFGNPFRSVAFAPFWLTSTLKELGTVIYAERSFDRLPFLADALEDAGCTAVDILNHLRQPGEHVRGCWVLDLVLEKE